MQNNIINNFITGETDFNTTIKNIEATIIKKIKDCTTGYWGMYNDFWDMSFCYNNEHCIKWDKWKEKSDGE